MTKFLFHTVLLGSLLSFQLASFAQSVPRLRRNMTYAQARTMLIRRGWQPVVNSEQVNNRDRSSAIDYLITRKGYNEIVDCAGTGLGLCLFQFKNNRGQILFVTTANNEPQQESTVYGWRLE